MYVSTQQPNTQIISTSNVLDPTISRETYLTTGLNEAAPVVTLTPIPQQPLVVENSPVLLSQPVNFTTGIPLIRELSITSIEVASDYNRLLNQVKNPITAQALKDVQDRQDKLEEELINDTNVCDVPMLSALRDRIGGLQAVELKEYTIKQLQNPSVMKAAMCVSDSIFYTSPYDVGSLYLNNRIRMYIHNLRQIGPESAEGYSLIADFENAKDMFLLKTSRSPANDTLLHELVVGLYGTNRLRKYIPNYAYVFGGFKCSPPLVDPETKRVVTWCLHDSNTVNYVLYENLDDAIPMSKYLQTCTGSDFINVYMQVLYAERLALKVSDYTHYDLHYENVLLRTPGNMSSNQSTVGPGLLGDQKSRFQIAYETERGVEYIKTSFIPTINDYGFSHIKTLDGISASGAVVRPGDHFGRSGFVPFSIFAYRSWIMHDMYKFLMFCMMAAVQYNNQSVMSEAIKIFRFFNHTEDPIIAIRAQSNTKFSFPLNELTNSLSINDFAAYIRTVCNCDFINSQRSTDPILNCEKMCLTGAEVLTKVGMNPNGPIGVPDNIIEFYDIAVRLQNESRETEKQQMAKSFVYQEAMKLHINTMNKQIQDLTDLRRKLKLVDIGQMTIEQVLQYNTMMIVRSMYISVGAIIDKTVTLKFYYEIGLAVARSYQDDGAVRAMDDILNQFNRNIRPGLEDAKKVLGSNDVYLNRIQADVVTRTRVQNDERLRWYWEGRKLFDVVFGRTIIDSN